jgi:hypothetical protein
VFVIGVREDFLAVFDFVDKSSVLLIVLFNDFLFELEISIKLFLVLDKLAFRYNLLLFSLMLFLLFKPV